MAKSNWRYVSPVSNPDNQQACGWCGRWIGNHSTTSLEICLTSLSGEEIKGHADMLERLQKAESKAGIPTGETQLVDNPDRTFNKLWKRLFK